MTFARHSLGDDPATLPRMPTWVTSVRAETLEDVAFLSGAALNHLYVVLEADAVCQALLSTAVHLSRLGDLFVPSGDISVASRH